MSRTAVITDSNSGFSQEEAKTFGIYVLPMKFLINGKTYAEGVSLTHDDFYRFLADGADVSTTQPSPTEITDLWDEVLKTYEEAVYIPMSSGLSGACQTAMMLSHEDAYEGKVFVVDNQRISVTQKESVIDAKNMADKGYTAAEIHKKLMDTKFDSSIYITLDTLYYLKKGGRITPAAAAIGTLLRLKPVLQIQGEKLDAYAKARTYKLAKKVMMDAIKKDIDTRFGKDASPDNITIAFAHTHNPEAVEEFRKEVEAMYPGVHTICDELSLVIACHIGPGSLALTVSKKLHY